MVTHFSPTKSEHHLKNMFDAVPKHYDLLNRLLTFFFDEKWRKYAAHLCFRHQPTHILDLCCGTGDLTAHLLRQSGNNVKIKALDFSPAMLGYAQNKLASMPHKEQVTFIEGDASAIPFPSNHFDCVSIAFGFRNLTWFNPISDKALLEIRRILKPGGYFVILECSQPENKFLKKLFHLYLNHIVCPLGNLISNHKSAYHYLARSATNYYTAEQLSELLTEAQFKVTEFHRFLGGIAAIHISEKALYT